MNQNDQDENLSLLLADVYQSDERALELLVKYASDPASLDAGERNEVEARLARDASWQDRLRVLQNFDHAMALDDADALDDAAAIDGAIEREQPELAPVVELGRYRAPRVALWLAAASIVGFVLWNTGFTSRIFDPSERNAPMIAESPIDVPDAPLSQDKIADHIAPEDLTASSRGDTAVSASESSLVAAGNEDPQSLIEAEASQEAAGSRHEVAESELAFPAEDDAPLQIAMLSAVRYRAPADRALRTFLGDEIRGTASEVALSAWVPDHVARTANPQPKLYWEIEGRLPEQHTLGFVITSETDTEPLFESTLEEPMANGRQSIDLEQLGIELAEDTVYRWTVFARAPSSDPSEDRIAQGWVQFRVASASLSSEMLSGPTAEHASHYAEGGYWYDALALLVGLTESHPEDTKVQAALAGFLADAGIE